MTDHLRKAEQALADSQRGESDLAATDAGAHLAELARVNERLQRELAESRRAEAAHGEDLERLRLLGQQLPGFIWATDRELRLTMGTGLTMREGSPSPSQLIGMTMAEVFGTTDPEFGPLAAYRAALGGVSSDIELPWLGREVRAQIDPLRNAAGEIVGTVGLATDITERKRLQQELLHTKIFLDSIVENIPDTVFVKDAKSLEYVLFNRAVEDLLGHKRADLVGKNDYDIFPKAVADFFTKNDRAVLHDKTLLDIPEESIRTAQHGERIMHTRKIPILDDKGEPVYLLGISEDITDRKHAEQIQRRHERETAIVSDILRAINVHLDVQAAFPEIFAGLREIAGCAAVGLNLFDESREWLSFVAADPPRVLGPNQDTRHRAAELPALADLLAGRPHVVRDLATELQFSIARVIYKMGFRSLVRLPLCAGSDVVGVLNLYWREVDGCQTGEMGTLRQVTNAVAIAVEKNRLFAQVSAGQARLAALSRQLMEVQETERRYLAHELHDEIGQYLTGIHLLLHEFKQRPPGSPSAPLDMVQKLVEELITRVRDLSLDLRPAMLDDLGLLPALKWLFERSSQQTNIAIDFHCSGLDRRFPQNVETAAYRIVQEALTNVARHAGVSQARVLASADDHHLSVEIADHGKGFDGDAALAGGTTSGLSGMRERAMLMGGRLSVESGPGAGTRVRAEFKLGNRN